MNAFAKRSLTFTCWRAVNPRAANLDAYTFRRREDTTGAAGWTDPKDPSEDCPTPPVMIGTGTEFLTLRVDARKPDKTMLRARIEAEIALFAKSHGGKCKGEDRREIRNRLTEEAIEEAPWRTTFIDVAWHRPTGLVFVAATGKKADLAMDYFKATFGILEGMVPQTLESAIPDMKTAEGFASWFCDIQDDDLVTFLDDATTKVRGGRSEYTVPLTDLGDTLAGIPVRLPVEIAGRRCVLELSTLLTRSLRLSARDKGESDWAVAEAHVDELVDHQSKLDGLVQTFKDNGPVEKRTPHVDARLIPRATIEERAKTKECIEGREARRQGKSSLDNPYPMGSEAFYDWGLGEGIEDAKIAREKAEAEQ